MRKSFSLLLLIFSLVLGTSALAQTTGSQLRFAHAVPGAPAIDVYVDDELAASGIEFGDASDYIAVADGDRSLTVTAAGDTDALWTQTVTADGAITLVASATEALTFDAYPDNIDPLALGQARLTAIHAIEGGPVVDVVLTDGRQVIAGLEYGVPYGTLDVPSFAYELNVTPTGEEITSALFSDPIVAPLHAGTSYMVMVYGSGDAPEVTVLDAAVNPNPGDGFVQFVHDVEDGPAVDVYVNDQRVAASLAFGESTVFMPLASGEATVEVFPADTSDEPLLSTTLPVMDGEQVSASVIVGADGAVTVDLSGAAAMAMDDMDTEMAEAPAVEEAEVPATEDEMVEAAEAPVVVTVIVEVTPTPAPAVAQAPTAVPEVQPAVPTDAPVQQTAPGISGRVILDPGANLQLRQYPDPDALSLGLAPSGTVFEVVGREGAPVQLEDFFDAELQEEIDNFVDPAEDILEDEDADLDSTQTWVKVNYFTPDGGVIDAWVLSQFLDIRDEENEPQRLAELPLIPSNDFGEAVNTDITPPPVRDDQVFAVVTGINPGVNLQIRRNPDQTGESLGLIPAGSQVEFLGFALDEGTAAELSTAENANWVYIRYTQPDQAGTVTGWASSQYLAYTWRGRDIELDEMDDRDLLAFESTDTIGELGRGVAPPAQPTVDPLQDAIVATVTIDPGANLQFRRTPDVQGESLGLIPSNTQMIVSGRSDSNEWLQVEFEGQVGWVATDFVRLTFNGAPYELADVPVTS